MAFTTLIPPAELAGHIGDPAWVVVDCRFTLTDTEAGRRSYAAGHVPGARYAHLDEDLSSPVTARSGRHPLPDAGVFAATLGRWGVAKDTQVVAYDDIFGAIASRLWWLLRWVGHEAVAVLDGGLPRWQREGHPLTAELPRIEPTRYAARADDGLWVDAGRVQQVLAAGRGPVIDARAEERFRGEVEPLDPVAGHIPGTLNRPYEDNLDIGGEFLPAAELRAEYRELLGGRSPAGVVHLCGSGVTACHNILAMEAAGLAGSVLYAGSWSEWITDRRRPVATGE